MTAENKKSQTYEKGDPAKGKPDFKTGEPKIVPMRDTRAYLVDQAQKNEAANDELQARQVEQIQKFQAAQVQRTDPDVVREESMEEAAYDPHSKEAAAKRAQSRAAMKPAAVSDTAPGNNRTVQGKPVPPGTVEPSSRRA